MGGRHIQTSVDQVTANALTTVPLVKGYPQVAQNLIDAWYGLWRGIRPEKSGVMTLPVMKKKLVKGIPAQAKADIRAGFSQVIIGPMAGAWIKKKQW